MSPAEAEAVRAIPKTLAEYRALVGALPDDVRAMCERSACLDCGTLTWLIGEYYMLQDRVWSEANPAGKGMLCIGCLEHRLGRRLEPSDFTGAPINTQPARLELSQSKRLNSRLKGGTP